MSDGATSFIGAASDAGSGLAAGASDIGSSLVSVGGDLGVTGLPSVIGDTASGLVSSTTGAVGGAAGGILQGVSDLAGGLTSALPAFTSTAAGSAASLAGGIGQGVATGQPINVLSSDSTMAPAVPHSVQGAIGGNLPLNAGTGSGTSAAALTPGSGDTGGGGWFSGLNDWFKQNQGLLDAAKLGIPVAGLGYELLTAKKPLTTIPGYNQLNTQAQQLSTQGQQLASYLQTGTLPPGVHQSLTQAGEAAKAAIRSKYAAAGMSGSSSEAADIANVDVTIAGQGANIASQLLTQGVSESNLSAQLYSQIMQTALQQDQQLGAGIAALAGAAARPTINVTGATVP